MAVVVNTDGANNVYIGTQVPTKSTSVDLFDSIQAFINQMVSVGNWGAGGYYTPITNTNAAARIEWRPSSTHFPQETLTGTIPNFADNNSSIASANARFRAFGFESAASSIRVSVSSQAGTSTLTTPTFSSVAGTDIYRIIGDRHGIIYLYTKTNSSTSNYLFWFGLLAEPRTLFTEYQQRMGWLYARHNTTNNNSGHVIKTDFTDTMPILTSGAANYPIACANGSTPNTSLWATDLYLRENNPAYNNPVIGRVPNILLGRGSAFVLNNYYKLPAADQTGASTLFYCAAVWGTDFLLVRTFEEPT